MYDEFFNDVILQFYEQVDTADWKRASFWYNQIWEDMFAYYNDHIFIQESEII